MFVRIRMSTKKSLALSCSVFSALLVVCWIIIAHAGSTAELVNETKTKTLKVNTNATSTENEESAVNPQTPLLQKYPKIVLYSVSSDSACKATKEFFNRNNISFINRDLNEDSGAIYDLKKYNPKFLPLIVIGNDENVLEGFNEEKLTKLLGIKEKVALASGVTKPVSLNYIGVWEAESASGGHFKIGDILLLKKDGIYMHYFYSNENKMVMSVGGNYTVNGNTLSIKHPLENKLNKQYKFRVNDTKLNLESDSDKVVFIIKKQ